MKGSTTAAPRQALHLHELLTVAAQQAIAYRGQSTPEDEVVRYSWCAAVLLWQAVGCLQLLQLLCRLSATAAFCGRSLLAAKSRTCLPVM